MGDVDTLCVRADGLLVDADEYKQKIKKSTYLANGYRAHEHAIALHANALACGHGWL